MSSCIGLLPSFNITRKQVEYGFFNQRSVSWRCHLIPHLLNVGGTTPPSPLLSRTDQGDEPPFLSGVMLLDVLSQQRRNNIPYIFGGATPLIKHTRNASGTQPPSLLECFIASFVTGSTMEPNLTNNHLS
ncbi:hypothetical protein PIB30_081889 [Stylosanthes scabra]|uniref:Uncharacterized protein n=1 Tax=Stylosanthes scabra TaxID=79078 RepID=A0ABU6UQP4_9FABA|nr:hypothetical protein [Stylosanthes scabra]